MTYQEWADEYLDNANKIKEKIIVLKEQRTTAPIKELKEINFRIAIMYEMYLDCMHIAEILRKRKGVAF